MMTITRGLDLPISGAPEQAIKDTRRAEKVAVLASDFVGMKPTMEVRVADEVAKGQCLFTDRKSPRVRYTAPVAGRIDAIHRGAKRALLSVAIRVTDNSEVLFKSYTADQLSGLAREEVIEQLLESGQWTALRVRPFGRVADPDMQPHSLFITAMDSNPLAPSIPALLAGNEGDFVNGVKVLSKLTEGTLYVCKAGETQLPALDLPNVQVETFRGPHPAGNVGTHIHFLDPVSRNKSVWHMGLQDVVATGRLFTTGKLANDRVISLAGPGVRQPRLVRTCLGADVAEVVRGELREGEQRVISGSVLSGHHATGAVGYLGRFHQQITVIREEIQRQFLGWLTLGFYRFSVKNIAMSRFYRDRQFDFTTSTHGEVRAILPSGSFEDLMPLDIMPLFLMRALAVDDVEEAEALGALELDEEDLSLCAFVCPSKLEFGPMLRRNLALIEKEG